MNYRLYSFANMYLSSLQKGLQTAHLVGEMNSEYSQAQNRKVKNVVDDWQSTDKTIIILDGGTSENIHKIYSTLGCIATKYNMPFSSFSESEEALNGAITCAGIILPEYLYAPEDRYFELTSTREFLDQFQLAV